MAGTTQEAVYESRAIPFVREFYADLDYDETGNLIITREHAAVDAEAAAARTMRAIREGKVRSVTGKDVPVVVESVCVLHSGTPGAVAVAREVHRAIEAYLS
jgi:5-oxoprolinase (ATP-hydrolysing) subunit A